MEDVAAIVDAMTSAVDAVEAMVKAVEMREWLEVGRTETERTTAVHFFSGALAVQKQKDYIHGTRRYILPLYWPGRLPGLPELLSDSLLPHNSKAIQSAAMLSIRGIILIHNLSYDVYHYFELLVRLVRETECTEIRDQAIWLLGRMSFTQDTLDQRMTLLPLFIDIVSKYAAILEPTETEISSLNTALKALEQVWPSYWEPPIPQNKVLPVLVGILQKPGKRKKAQIRASQLLAKILPSQPQSDVIPESGVIGVLIEAVRVGKEPTAVLYHALDALCSLYARSDAVIRTEILDKGALGVFHLVLKRTNDSFKGYPLWSKALFCLCRVMIDSNAEEKVEAVLSQDGLVELVLDLALGMDMSKETRGHHMATQLLLWMMTECAAASQVRRLLLKGPLFRLLNRYLNSEGFSRVEALELKTVRYCLAKCPAGNQRVLRRLLDSSGITDTIRRFSLDVSPTIQEVKYLACDILDTYLNNPLPTPPSVKLPSIIYTRNYPY